MDFGALPPEVNSTYIYAGPGSKPMLATAAAWNALAAELYSTAASYQAVISNLISEGWMGPSSAATVAAVAPYLAWMSATAELAEHTAAQARAAAGAYEAAFAMTVPPQVVVANRNQLMALVATNILGQNNPAIAATEARYGEMWAQDAAAMYSYAGESAAATTLPPFTEPAPTTNQGGLAEQASAVGQATGSAAATKTQSMLSQLNSDVPTALQGLTSPLKSTGDGDFGLIPGRLGEFINPWFGSDDGSGLSLNSQLWNTIASTGMFDWAGGLEGLSGMATVGFLARGLDGTAALTGGGLVPTAGPALASAVGAGELGATTLTGGVPGSGVPSASAQVSKATLVGALSVPPTWHGAALPGTPTASALPTAGGGTVPPTGIPGAPGVPAAGAGSRGLGFAAPRYGFRPAVVTRPPSAG